MNRCFLTRKDLEAIGDFEAEDFLPFHQGKSVAEVSDDNPCIISLADAEIRIENLKLKQKRR